MECLQNFIGLKGAYNTPASGLLLNSLAGITTDLYDRFAETEDGAANAWQNIQEVASRRFYTDVISKLRINYRLKTVSQDIEVQPPADGNFEAGNGLERGIRLKLGWTQRTFQAFTVAKVLFNAHEDGDIIITVRDHAANELFTKVYAVVEGWNELIVDKTFVTTEINITYDAAIASNSTQLTDNCYQLYYACMKTFCRTCRPDVYGITFSGGSFTNTKKETHGFGVIGDVSCDYSAVICNNKELFTSAWMFLLGNQSMIELLNSYRVNSSTTVDRKPHEELRDFYQVEYENQLKAAVEGLNVDTSYDCCIECRQNPEAITWLP